MLLAGSLTAVSCRGEGPVGTEKTREPGPLTGTWRVTTDRGDARDMRLVQQGGAFSGEVDGGTVTGSVDGAGFTIQFEDGAVRGTGVVTGDSMAGEYVATEEGQAGKWEAVRETTSGRKQLPSLGGE